MKTESLFSIVKDRLIAYRKRQAALRLLTAMDDHQLRDIGLTTDDLVAIENGSFLNDSSRRQRPYGLRPVVVRTPSATPVMKNAA